MVKRRQVHFDTLDDVLRDAESLLRHGYQKAGNWSLGQVGDHLGRAIRMSREGFPWAWNKVMQRLARKLFLRKFLSRTVTHLRLPSPITVKDFVDDQEGVACLAAGIERFQQPGGDYVEHMVFGPLTEDQWTQFHLWHCEHHLSFLIPDAAARSTSGAAERG